MREFYSQNSEKVKAVFVITFIKNSNTLKNMMISEEELIGSLIKKKT